MYVEDCLTLQQSARQRSDIDGPTTIGVVDVRQSFGIVETYKIQMIPHDMKLSMRVNNISLVTGGP